MADRIIKSDNVYAVNVEVTEGTYVGPGSATDGYFQPNEDGAEMVHNIDQVERPVISNGLAVLKARGGIRYPSGTMGIEVKGSGTEGQAPVHGVLFEALLGTKHTISSTTTTKASGNTQTNLKIEDADISKFAVNDIVVVKQSGEHSFQVVTAVDSTGGAANIEVFPGRLSGSFSNSVVISKSVTYKPADSGHPTVSISEWVGGTIFRKAMGCRVKGMSLEDFVTGKIATTSFSFEGLEFSEADGAPSHTPNYDDGLPPIVLNADVFYNGAEVAVNEVELSVEQDVSFKTSTGSANGRVTGRAAGKRKISGTLSPYKDDTSVAYYTAFVADTNFSLLITARNPHASVAGEFEMGSCFAIWLPQCKIVNKPVDDLDGVLRDVLEFVAHGGNDGTTPEIAIGIC